MKDFLWDTAAVKKETPKPSEPEAAANSSNDEVATVNNRIYFYSAVRRNKILNLNKAIAALDIRMQNRANVLGCEPGKIFLHINSFGGSVFAGFAALDYIKTSSTPITTIIDGCAASAATLMSVAGDERLMHKHSFMLIHQLSSGMWGKYEDLQDGMKNNDLLMKTIKNVYAEHTKIPQKELNKILKHDLWWDAETCLKYGLIDRILV